MFEVSDGRGTAFFETENDAINALWLLGSCHDMRIDREQVKRYLGKCGYFDLFPLSITKYGEYPESDPFIDDCK